MPAPKPARSTGSITIGWGLVAIPCSLYSGLVDSAIQRHEFVSVDGEYHSVGRKEYDKVTGEDIDPSTKIKCYETERGLVELTNEEIDRVLDADGGGDVIAFLRTEYLMSSRLVVENAMQIRATKPKTKKPSAAFDKAFALLMASMRMEGTFALVRVTLRGKPGYAVLTSEGWLYTIHFDDEVREPLDLPDSGFSEQELAMGRQLVRDIAQDQIPDLEDTWSAKVAAYAEAKAAGNPVPTTPEPTRSTGDLITALEASLIKAKSKEVA